MADTGILGLDDQDGGGYLQGALGDPFFPGTSKEPSFLGATGLYGYEDEAETEFDSRRPEELELPLPGTSRSTPPSGVSTPFPRNTSGRSRPSSSVRPKKELKIELSPERSKTKPGAQQTSGMMDLETIKMVLDSYSEVVSKATREKYKIPPVAIPKFKTGGDWRCFLAEFKEMVRLADLKPSHQLAYLKQAVPDEAKKMLYQHKVDAVDVALEMLTELYEPVKDSWQALQELQKVTQQSGERLRVLAGRIQDATRPIKLPAKELDDLVKSRFKHALADSETRNLLLWEKEDVSLDQMIQKAQQFEDAKLGYSSKSKKILKTSTTSEDSSELKRELEKLKQKLAEMQKAKDVKTKTKATCWNCGRKGHFSRNCQQEKVGDGFTHRPKSRGRGRGKTESKAANTQTETLNFKTQGD